MVKLYVKGQLTRTLDKQHLTNACKRTATRFVRSKISYVRQRKISNNNNNNKRKIEKRSLQLTYANDKKEGKTKTRKV